LKGLSEDERQARLYKERGEADEETLMRSLADLVEWWRHCDGEDMSRCRRARRCAAEINPCFVKHRAEFRMFIRERIIPELRRQNPTQDHDTAGRL
jgi:hypothetical protein